MRATFPYEQQDCKHLKHFVEVICTNGGRGFIKGDIYAMGEATNNALYILSCDDKGDPVNFGVHCVGEGKFLPADGEDWYTDKCPVFEIIA